MSEHIFVTDFGGVRIPRAIGESVAVVPTRRDGWFDRRYKLGKRAEEWHRAVQARATEIWVAGGEMQPDDIPAFK